MSDYWHYLGLNNDPFTPLVDVKDLFFTSRASQQLELLQNLSQSGSHLFLVTGIKGVGKTSLLRGYKASLKTDVGICEIMGDKSVTAGILEQLLTKHLNLSPQPSQSFQDCLVERLQKFQGNGEKFLLIIDNAHALPEDTHNFLINIGRDLSSLNAAIAIILVGGPQLNAGLDFTHSHLVAEAITHTFYVEPFTVEDTKNYVYHRLRNAGLTQDLKFTQRQWEDLHRNTQGVPAKINMLAKNSLFQRSSKIATKKPWWKLNVIKK